jgi:poly-gamma-glutamate synthesis protein (capsule biosynthesis protein)
MRKNNKRLFGILGGVFFCALLIPGGPSPAEKLNAACEMIPQSANTISLIAAGDVSFSRGIAKVIRVKNNFNFPLEEIKSYLKNADLVFCNLESPITPGRIIVPGEMVFRSDPQTAQILKNANFAVVSLANNHILNFGRKGLANTWKYLKEANILHTGTGTNKAAAVQPAYLRCGGLRLAFLAFVDKMFYSNQSTAATPYVATMNPKEISPLVKDAKRHADFVIVSMHSGNEYTEKLTASQVNFAHAAIDAGADLVIGHHPHVVQKAEKYKGKYIFYSLGNFIFDQNWSRETSEGLMAKFFISKTGLEKVEVVPVLICSNCQPQVLTGPAATKVLKRLKLPLHNEQIIINHKETKRFSYLFSFFSASAAFNFL